MRWRLGRATVLASLGLFLACGDTGPMEGPGPGIAAVRVRALTPPALNRFAPGLVVEQVRASLIRFANDQADTVESRTIPFGVDQNAVSVNFSLVLAAVETLYAELDYQTAAGQTLFFASQQVVARPGATNQPPFLQPVYAGPGGNIAVLSLTPIDTVISAGDSVQYDVTALDSSQAAVTTFYASWTTNDPRVTINALGLLRAPDLTKLVTVTAQTPNGTFATTSVTLLGSAGLGLSPDSVEKLPGGTQQFTVALGGLRTSQYVWSVEGVDGGNATVGTVDTTGFYTAPASVPPGGRVDVCARDITRTGIQGCAVVVITNVPSAGADVIVFNDINFLSDYTSLPGNRRFIANLATFQNNLPRGDGTQVLHELSHGSLCIQLECSPLGGLQAIDTIFFNRGFQVAVFDTISRLPATIPPQVKLMILWVPSRAYDTLEINTLKAFAAEGGRILYLGERLPYYGQFNIDSVENRFFREMGAQLSNTGADVALAAPYIVPKSGIRTHQTTTGVDSLGFSAASIVVPGANDFALVIDTPAGQGSVLGALAKIDLTPLPPPVAPVRAMVRQPPGMVRRPTTPSGAVP